MRTIQEIIIDIIDKVDYYNSIEKNDFIYDINDKDIMYIEIIAIQHALKIKHNINSFHMANRFQISW